VLTLISGSATVKLPSVPATISISETFVFTAVLLFGPAAGTLTVALDALVISIWLAWRGHPFYRLAFNVAALPASLWVGAQFYFWMGDVPPLYSSQHNVEIIRLLVPLLGFTVVYFLLNSWLIAVAISLEHGGSPLRVWKNNFAWLSLNYFGGASVAALLITYTRNIDYAYLAFGLPLLAIIYFTFSMSLGRVADANKHLTELNALYLSTVETLAMAIDAKDQITHGHIRRVQMFAIRLAQELDVTEPAQIRAIEAASLLHDMGKLAVPEYILNKPGPLTAAEFEKMKLHATVGADILSSIAFPYPVVPIVRHHHENWDGTGYPAHLKGTDIPIGARILAVVDCFDALTSDRPYRPKLPDSEAIRILQERRGSMYDPMIVDAFIALHTKLACVQIPQPHDPGDAFSAIGGRVSQTNSAEGSGFQNIAASSEESLILYELTRDLALKGTAPEIVPVLARNLRRLMPVTTIALYSYDPELDELVLTAADGEHSPHLSGLRIARGQRLSGWVAANRQTIVNSDPALDLGETARKLVPRLRSCLSAPLVSVDRVHGVLSLYSTREVAFSEDHGRIISSIASQIAKALESSNLRQRTTSRTKGSEPILDEVDQYFRSLTSSRGHTSVLFAEVTGPVDSAQRLELTTSFVREYLRDSLPRSGSLFQLNERELLAVFPTSESNAALAMAKAIQQVITSVATSLSPFRVRFGTASSPVDGSDFFSLIQLAEQRADSHRLGEAPRSVH
jgi:putative nucleotidyltransferase with HDIG domain